MSVRKPSFKTKEIEVAGFKGYQVWTQITKDHKVKKEHKHKRVWVAGEGDDEYRILKDVHSKGSKGWRNGGVTIIEMETGRERFYSTNKVRLHPKG